MSIYLCFSIFYFLSHFYPFFHPFLFSPLSSFFSVFSSTFFPSLFFSPTYLLYSPISTLLRLSFLHWALPSSAFNWLISILVSLACQVTLFIFFGLLWFCVSVCFPSISYWSGFVFTICLGFSLISCFVFVCLF